MCVCPIFPESFPVVDVFYSLFYFFIIMENKAVFHRLLLSKPLCDEEFPPSLQVVDTSKEPSKDENSLLLFRFPVSSQPFA